jgi:hypothetical protein
MVDPATIADPQFAVVRVLHNDGDFSITFGRWEGTPCCGVRWNGEPGRLGYPVGRHRQPKFLVIPDTLTMPMLGMLAAAALNGTNMDAVAATMAELHPMR